MTSTPLGIGRATALALSMGAATLIATGAQAEEDRRWYVAPALNFVIADSDRQADDDVGLQIGFGRQLSSRLNLELNLEADNLDFEDGSGTWKQRGASIDGLYFFGRNPAFSPYALLGVGALHNRVPGDNVTNFMANAGLGFLANATNDISLRGQVRYRWDNDDETIPAESSFGDWVVSLGVQIPLGRAATPAPAPAPAPEPEPEPAPEPVAPVDTDGDGVPDADDACPDTPAGAEVDARGCEIDSDGDGVPDSRDRCPGTPAGATVDTDGCEVDSDGDGVPDSMDRCPDTAAGVRVDIHGCEIQEVTALEGVTFEIGSARLAPESTAVLDETAATLLRHPDIRAEIAGHSDSTGPRALNLDLSRQRAESVRAYLISQGVAADRLTAAGYGPDHPVANNATPEGRTANRRVELQIIR